MIQLMVAGTRTCYDHTTNVLEHCLILPHSIRELGVEYELADSLTASRLQATGYGRVEFVQIRDFSLITSHLILESMSLRSQACFRWG